jgi:hypothetical protein
MIELPKTVKVGWATYVVEVWPETEARDRHRAGEILYNKLLIRINDGCPPAKQVETLLHEIGHAITDVWAIAPVDLAKDRDPEEQLTCLMGSAWATVMCDNPDLRRFLDEVWPR